MEYYELMFLLVSFVIVLAVALYVTKNVAKIKMQGVGRNMQIIEVLPIAFNQYIYLVRVGETYHMFCGTKERLNYCSVVNKDEILIAQKEEPQTFDKYLKKLIKNKQEKDDEKVQEQEY